MAIDASAARCTISSSRQRQPGLAASRLTLSASGQAATTAAGSSRACLASAMAEAVQLGRPLAPGPVRPAQRVREVERRVGRGAHPGDVGIVGQRDPRDVAVIGARLQRVGAPVRDGQVEPGRRQPAQILEPLRPGGLGGQHQRAAGAGDERDRRADAQIGAGARDGLLDRELQHGDAPPCKCRNVTATFRAWTGGKW